MNLDELKKKTRSDLKYIRDILDQDIVDVDITSQQNKGYHLTQCVGLAAACKANARKILEQTKLIKYAELKDQKLPPSVLLKVIEMQCADELALYEFSDRINAGISHALDMIRTAISLYKEELKNQMNGVN